jgi:hypothetical protein
MGKTRRAWPAGFWQKKLLEENTRRGNDMKSGPDGTILSGCEVD